MSIEFDFRHLLGLCKALREAEKGNLATGKKPDREDATRLRTALAEHDREQSARIRTIK